MGNVTTNRPTNFSGPIKAGDVKETVGSATKNVGYAVMAQSYEFSQLNSAAVTTSTIVIPANSQILDIVGYCTTTFDGTNETVSIGFNTAGDDISTNFFANATENITIEERTSIVGVGSDATIAQVVVASGGIAIMKDVGASDVTFYITQTAGGTAGRATFTVTYLQAINLT